MYTSTRYEFSPEVTGSALELFFDYSPSTGIFVHKTNRGGRSGGPGSPAGSLLSNGYIFIGLPGGKRALAHRLAWLWMTGSWPSGEIDHINGDRKDNRICNLRIATRPQQGANSGRRLTNSSGRTGVCFDKSRGMYAARICVNYKTINLGRYSKFEDAVTARKAAEEKYFGEFSPTNRESWKIVCP